MLHNNLIHILRLAVTLVFCVTSNSYASVANSQSWRDFGDKFVYFIGSNRCPAPSWLNRQQQVTNAFSEPDSRGSVMAVESFLEQALEGYERDSFAWRGRIALDINPRCILGLYLANRFPGTKLAAAGKRQFKRSIERACLVALGIMKPWQQLLETELTKAKKDSPEGFQSEFFGRSEVPFLLIYLIENGSSEAVQQHARKELAHCIGERYGLEPALRQYLILLEQGYITIDEPTKLEVAKQLEQTGAIYDAQQLYEKILQGTDSSEIAREAVENLAGIKLANSQQVQAWEVLDVLHKRFPDAQLTVDDLKDFFLNFQASREERLKQLFDELLTVQKEEKALQLCQLYDGLWGGQETLDKWQDVIRNLEPESLAWQCARFHFAWSLVNKEKLDEAKNVLDSLCSSSYPTIQARALLVSADIARGMDRAFDAVNLCRQAAQIERPTALPLWLKPFRIKHLDVQRLTVEELSFLASFLRGYNQLTNGNFRISTANLLKAKEIAGSTLRKSLFNEANKAIPGMLMLACAKMGDYARAEKYGLEEIRNLEEDGQDSKQSTTLPSQIEKVDNFLFVLFRELRLLPDRGSKSPLANYNRNIYTTVIAESLPNKDFGPAERDLLQLYWQIKRQRVARLLSAEYNLAKERITQPDSFKEFLNLEPTIFTAQLLRTDSFVQISRALAASTPQEYAKGQMYRFAGFAQQLKRPYMARMALNAAVQQIDSAHGNVELLENIAEMYLKGSSHQKTIQIYERIVEQASDISDAERAQFKIIQIYAEQLKLYDKAIWECQRFLKKFPDSQQLSQVEFLIGKMAYLDKDYAGATGQLDSYQRKYPDNPRVGEAMVLAALSRMSEGNTQDAIVRFTEIIRRYPDSDMAARSKFLIGYAQVSEQKYSHALETFKQLVEQFPNSRYTKQAQSFIDRLSKVSK